VTIGTKWRALLFLLEDNALLVYERGLEFLEILTCE